MPRVIEDPKDIDGPVIVKCAGAKGGRGYFIARDFRDFRRNVDLEEEFTIQSMFSTYSLLLPVLLRPTSR